ncbi:uncharacterized protein PFLUO_LOCUS3214 [Penicillium psychrofluorescens]|uniref:uncharacterized protein n=1 Tax=Penicillium psychrofluorescens TaxID=3158075 RepID=UPI003CCDEF3C
MASSARNILLVIADDLGKNLNIYGQENCPDTPNLDRLASQGSVFDYAFASTASCSGSRSTIYTGLHTHENGQYGLQLGYKLLHYFSTFPHIESHPALFNALGYLTGIVGKVHVGPDDVYPFTVRDESSTRDIAWLRDHANSFVTRAKDEKKPFFLTIALSDPHRDMTRGGFANDTTYPEVNEKKYDPATISVPEFLTDVPEVRQELAEYYQSIHRMDQGVGMFLDMLERQGVSDDTLVVFLSDNGPPFINSKATLYDSGVRLPMVIRCPGKKTGTRNSNLISYLDLLPTFLDWAGHSEKNKPEASSRRGRSFLSILDSEKDEADWDLVFGSHTFHETVSYYPTRFLRTRRYKYHRNIAWKLDFPFAGDLYGALSWEGIRNMAPPVKIGERLLRDYIERPPEQLFDLQNDPKEVDNLAEKPEHAETMKEMRSILEQWQRDTDDAWLLRDGQSVRVLYNHLDSGLVLPDRFDFDVDNPGNK